MMLYISYLGMIIIGLGIFLMITATIGIMRFPDFYSRIHPASIADSLGSALILIGLAMQCEFSVFTVKILLLICFLWITGTTSCHALAQSAYSIDTKDNKREYKDV